MLATMAFLPSKRSCSAGMPTTCACSTRSSSGAEHLLLLHGAHVVLVHMLLLACSGSCRPAGHLGGTSCSSTVRGVGGWHCWPASAPQKLASERTRCNPVSRPSACLRARDSLHGLLMCAIAQQEAATAKCAPFPDLTKHLQTHHAHGSCITTQHMPMGRKLHGLQRRSVNERKATCTSSTS